MTTQKRGLRSWWAKQGTAPFSCPCTKTGKTKCHCHHRPPTPTGECKKARLPGVSAASCASFLFSNVELPSDYRPPGEAASCWVCQEGPSKREGKRHLSRPRQGHTWAPQAVGPGQRPAPASLGRLPTHCGGRQLGWSPAQLCGRKTFVLGVWPRLVPPRRAGSLCSEDKH